MKSISIIVPVINESSTLPYLLNDLVHQSINNFELILVDGGSTDNTLDLAEEWQKKDQNPFKIKLISSKPGRALQMNAGSNCASNDILCFLHCDSRLLVKSLLKDAIEKFTEQRHTQKSDMIAGHFPLFFIREEGYPKQPNQWSQSNLFWRFLESKTTMERRWSINGDQGLMISRNFFNQLGCYPDKLPFMEDQILGEKIWSKGQWILLPHRLHTSGRRFEQEGKFQLYILMSIIMGMLFAGRHQFFTNAQQIYRIQSETKRLNLRPFYHSACASLLSGNTKQIFASLLQLGNFAKQNFWQLWFLLDVFCGLNRPGRGGKWLTTYDNYIHRMIQGKWFDLFTALLIGSWFVIILWPCAMIRDIYELVIKRFNLIQKKGAN